MLPDCYTLNLDGSPVRLSRGILTVNDGDQRYVQLGAGGRPDHWVHLHGTGHNMRGNLLVSAWLGGGALQPPDLEEIDDGATAEALVLVRGVKRANLFEVHASRNLLRENLRGCQGGEFFDLLLPLKREDDFGEEPHVVELEGRHGVFLLGLGSKREPWVGGVGFYQAARARAWATLREAVSALPLRWPDEAASD